MYILYIQLFFIQTLLFHELSIGMFHYEFPPCRTSSDPMTVHVSVSPTYILTSMTSPLGNVPEYPQICAMSEKKIQQSKFIVAAILKNNW